MKSKALKLAVFALIFALLLPVCASAEFSDVPEEHWAREYIDKCAELGYVQGIGDGAYLPENNVSVAELVAVACRMTGMDDKGLETGPSGHWAEPAMAWAAYMGWYGEADVEPGGWDAPVSRELASKIVLLSLFGENEAEPGEQAGRKILRAIKDKDDIGDSYLPYILRAYSKGILTGYPDGSFAPKAGITRAETAALLLRALELSEKENPAPEISGVSVSLPILMYHHVADEGDWAVSAEQLKKDLEELKAAGYTTIFLSEALAYVKREGTLPAKPIVISFDDGYYSNYELAWPILKDLGCKAEIAMIGSVEGKMGLGRDTPVQTAHFSWARAQKMLERPQFVNIISHTWALHGWSDERVGVLKAAGETYADYIARIAEDAEKMREEMSKNLALDVAACAYPYGRSTALADKLMETLGYEVTLSTEPGINLIAEGDFASLRNMKRITVSRDTGSIVEYIESFQEVKR